MDDRLAVLAVLGLVAGLTVGAVPGAVIADHTDPPPSDETFTAAEGIDVWERAFLPLRADTENASVSVPNADWRVRDADDDETSLNRDPVGVYDEDQTVTLTFDPSDASFSSSSFDGTDVELIAAHVEESGDASVPSNVSEALDLLTLENANENASFTEVTTKTLGSGSEAFSFNPDDSGVYVFFLAVPESGEDGFVIDGSGNISSVDGNVSIIGVEAVAVRKGEPNVDAPSSVVRGDSADFTVNDPAVAGEPLHHLVVLYHESTFENGDFVLNLTDDPNRDFDVENNSTILTSIDEVNGVATLEEPVGAFGVEVDDGSFSGSASTASIVEFVAESAGTDQPGVEDFDPNSDVILHGSAVGANRSATTTLTVETFGNWTAGEYRWVYIVVCDESRESAALTGTLSVEEESTDGGDDGGTTGGTSGGTTTTGGGTTSGGTTGGAAGGGQPPPPPPDDDDGVPPEFVVNVTPLVENVDIDILNATGDRRVPVDVPGLEVAEETGANLSHVNFTLVPPGDFDMTIVPDRTPPADKPPLDEERPATALSYIEITHTFGEADADDVSMRFRVRKAALEERGQRADNVALYRHQNGAWARIDAEVVDETDEAYFYEAEPPGLSTFAIGVGEPAFAVAGTSLSTNTVDPGETVEVAGSIQNAGEGTGTYTAELAVDGEVVDSRTVEVAPGDTAVVRFERTFDEPGRYAVSVGGEAAGTVEVRQPATASPLPPTATPADEFDLGLVTTVVLATVLVVIVVLSSLFLYHRRYE